MATYPSILTRKYGLQHNMLVTQACACMCVHVRVRACARVGVSIVWSKAVCFPFKINAFQFKKVLFLCHKFKQEQKQS
jgi:hypothetical protein